MKRLLGAACAITVVAWSWASPTRAANLAPMPWNLGTIFWDLPQIRNFSSLTMELNVKTAPTDQDRLYIAPIGNGMLNDVGFYGGIQSSGNFFPGKPSRMALFSRWNDRDPDSARISPGGTLETGNYEGEFVSVHQLVPWHAGLYEMTIAATEKNPTENWVTMTVTDRTSGMSWEVGSLRFPGPGLTLGSSLPAFVEAFGKAITPDHIPKADIVFGPIRVNDAEIVPYHALVRFEGNVPPLTEAHQLEKGEIEIITGLAKPRSSLKTDSEGHPYQDYYWK